MRKKLLITALFLSVMLSAWACGKDGGDGSPSPTGANEAVTPTAEPTPTPEVTLPPEATTTPEATPTSEATSTPEATLTTEATPTSEATPTPEVTPTSTATPTSEATPTPAATPTAVATATPKVTPTPEATPTPKATPTAKATPTPKATPTTKATPTPTGTERSKDSNPPTLTLEGDEVVTLEGGVWYKEPGFTATDKKDGNLTKSVKVEGEVKYWHVGTYTLKYSVKDSDGNIATAKRTVVVKARELPEPIDPGPMTIYLTFDDGPSGYTQQLLDVLAKYDVKATFFVTHNHKEADDMIIAEHAAGHTVAIHTYTHDYSKVYKSEKAYFDDMNRMADIIEDLIGERPAIIRFPGGSSNTVSKKYSKGIMTKLTQDMNELGILYFDWNVDSRDASSDSPKNSTKWWDPLVNNVINGIKNRTKNGKFSVVLQHDVKKFSVAAVEDIIKWGLENGYTFKALDLTTPTTGGVHQKVAN